MHLMRTFCWCKNAFDAKMHLMRCKNAFLHQMHFCVHFPLENVMLNILQRKMYALLNIFLWKMYAEHFPKENVRKNAFDAKMHFCVHFPLENVQRTFSKGKCSAKQNVMLNILLRKMYAKMHFCIKCIFAQHLCFLQSKKHSIFASNAFLQAKC